MQGHTLTAAHLAAWVGASPERQRWLVLPKAGGQDAVTACSYSCGSQEARSELLEGVEYGAGQTWSLLSPFAGGP